MSQGNLRHPGSDSEIDNIVREPWSMCSAPVLLLRGYPRRGIQCEAELVQFWNLFRVG